MKKTLLLTHEYYPYHGGVGRYCYQLFKRFDPGSYVVGTDQCDAAENASVRCVPLVSQYIRPRWLRGLWSVQKLVKQLQIECIMTPHILPLGIIAYTLHRYANIPYCISLHGLDINLALEKKRDLTINILRSAQHIITNSNATRAIVEELGVPTPIEVITPYLESDMLAVDTQTESMLREKYKGKKVLLTVGRLTKRKGQDMVIKALPEITRHVPNIHYCIVGSGPDQQYLESLIKEYKVADRVSMHTNVSDTELSAYYAIAHAFAMPSRKIGPDVEGFGMVYLTAAYFGLPIIAGNSGGEAEAVGDDSCAIRVNGDSLEEIIEAVSNLMNDDEIAAFLGSHAKEHLSRLPNWDAQAKKLEKILS